MRILIALVFLTGCDDTGSSGFLPPNDALFASDGGCHDYSGATPEDWVDPGELARAEAEDFRGCFIDQRLRSSVANRCQRGEYTQFQIDALKEACFEQPDDYRINGVAECFDIWATGTCNEIADGPTECRQTLDRVRDASGLVCP